MNLTLALRSITQKNRLLITEIVLIVLVWIVLIAAPLFLQESNSNFWFESIAPIELIIPLVIVFVINRFVLVPKLLFNKKSSWYFIIVSVLVASVTAYGHYSEDLLIDSHPPLEQKNEWMMPPPLDNMYGTNSMHAPFMQQGNSAAHPSMPTFLNVLIFSILLVGFDTGLRTSYRLLQSEKEKSQLEVKNVQSQLAFLRNQISPHFFMNTLNNIHALIDIDTVEAKDSVIQLSKLMNHLLYECEVEFIEVQKEIDFIYHYVDLMKLRYSDAVNINFSLPDDIPSKKIPPLLFTSYIENAFKHGVSYRNKSYINIMVRCTNDQLVLGVINSNHAKQTHAQPLGIGVENSKKRLDLIYGKNYTLNVSSTHDAYSVQLTIPI